MNLKTCKKTLKNYARWVKIDKYENKIIFLSSKNKIKHDLVNI